MVPTWNGRGSRGISFPNNRKCIRRIVLDRHWNLLLANKGAATLLCFPVRESPTECKYRSSDLRGRGRDPAPYFANWEQAAGEIAHRLHQEVAWGADR